MSENERKVQNFVLVHGACHGAWCWYKVKPLLEASGHRVTALELAASGIDTTKSITEITTCKQYAEPLMKFMTSFPSDEKVVLVGHSLGGLIIAMAMDKFPDKIYVSVFLTALMPDTKTSPCFVLNQDLELGLLQKRPGPGSWFVSNLSKRTNFSDEGYGSVPRAYIVSKKDKGIPVEYQKWMIENFPVNLVMEMEKTDHMPMFCKPQQLCDYFLEIADKFV